MMLADAIARAQAGLATAAAHLAAAPGEARTVLAAGTEALQSGPGVRAFAYLLVVFLVAGGVEWLYWIYAAPGYRWLLAGEPASRLEAWALAGRRAAIGMIALLLSTTCLLATSAFFVWPPGVQDAIVAVALVMAAGRIVHVAAGAVLAPTSPRMRLVRVTTPEARRLVPGLGIVATLLAAGLAAPELLRPVAPAVADSVGILTFVFASAILVAGVGALGARRRGPRPRRHFPPAQHWAALWCAVVALMWLAGAQRWTLTIVVASLALVAEAVSRRAVRSFWRAMLQDRPTREVAQPGPASGHAVSGRSAAGVAASASEAPAPRAPRLLSGDLAFDLSLRAVRFVVALAAIGACVVVWDIPILMETGAQTLSARLVSQAISVLALVLLADLAWAAVKGSIDGLLSRMQSEQQGVGHAAHGSGPNGRLLTLLPMARKATGVCLLVLVAVSILSILGIAITPLLAGAGVVGIAIGFGAQTLVKDLLSGVFYLAEDVFRLGDYIEAGSAKGTVERITLRTVALRHQNGPLHYVTYGSLGSVRNNSRDWVIDKFELPLPVDVDSEVVRKLIKAIGQEMLSDPDLASAIVEPLKAKVYRIEPGVKIFRCKIQTPPGRQFEVRAAAFRRIEAALRAKGIPFADARSRIVLSGGPYESQPEQTSPVAPRPAALPAQGPTAPVQATG